MDMSSLIRQYAFGTFFLIFGIYQATMKDYLEVTLYMTAGAAFIFNSLSKESRLANFKAALVVITWALIIIAAVLFLYVLQFKL